MPWVQSWTHDCPTLAWHVSWVQGHTHNCSSRSSTCVMGSKLNPRLLCSEPDMCHESNPGPPNALSGPGMCHESKVAFSTALLRSLTCIMGSKLNPWLLYTEPDMCHESNLGPTTALPGSGMCHESKVALTTALPGAWHVSCVLPWSHDCPTWAWHVLWVQSFTHNCSLRSLTCVMGFKLNPWLLYTEHL